jgi:hypothetical protein
VGLLPNQATIDLRANLPVQAKEAIKLRVIAYLSKVFVAGWMFKG